MGEPLTSDQIFISKLTDIIMVNLANENFGVKELARESGLGYYKLNLRIHSITKKKVSQFIREVRLQKALELLRNEELSASEVAYKVGFGSPIYFNKCFHEFFGYPPGKAVKVNSIYPESDLLAPIITDKKAVKSVWRTYILSLPGILVFTLIIGTTGFIIYEKINKSEWTSDLVSSDGRISIAVMPFRNMTNDTVWNIWQDGIQECMISSLANNKELKVRQKETINTVLEAGGLTKYSSISPGVAGRLSQKLDANLFIYGSIKQAGSVLRFDAQLISTKTREVIKSFSVEGVFREDNIFKITDTLSKNLMDFLVISKLIKKNPILGIYPSTTKSPEAFRNYTYWLSAFRKADYQAASNWLLKALALDSNFVDAMFSLTSVYEAQGRIDKALAWILKLYGKRDQVSSFDQLWVDHAYAYFFKPPGEQIEILKQIQEIDDRLPNLYYALGSTYNGMEDYYNAISEFEKCLEMYHELGKSNLKDNWVYPALGEMYHKTGQFKKEKKLYKEAGRINSDHSSIFFSWIIRNQAILSLTNGDTVAGSRYIKEFISVLKKNSSSEADISEGLAVIYWSVGNLEKAEGFYRQALRLDPENPGRINTLANFFISNNRNLNEVSELMDKAMKLAPDTYDYYNYLDTKGWGLYKQGRYLEALEILQKTWDSIPFPIYRIKSHLEEIKKVVAGQK